MTQDLPDVRGGSDAASRSRVAVFTRQVRACMRPPENLLVRPDTALKDIVGLLARSGFVLVVDDGGCPLGLIEAADIARALTLGRLPPEAPARALMRAPMETVQRSDYVYMAIARMRRGGLDRLAVVDRHGRAVGVVTLADALSVAAEGLLARIDRLSGEGAAEGLVAVRTAATELAEALLADHLPAPEVLRLLTAINNDLYRRVGEQALAAMRETGWGEVPVAAVTIVMGSGGRGENFLAPDQDNGFILADYDDAEHDRIDGWFRELATRMCRDLDAIGIRYCNGYCMAINPLWRKTLPQWQQQVRLWVKKSNVVSIRLSDIFFDFQPVWGDGRLAATLRDTVTGLVRGNPAFLRQMFQETAMQPLALGFFGGFLTERGGGAHRGELNLKTRGILPLVSAVRLLALREGVTETATLARIEALMQTGVLAEDEAADLRAAFGLLSEVVLRQQIADFRAGAAISYFIDPRALAKPTRRRLQAALRAVERLHRRVDYEFTARLF
jgi:CBS domain-containing protein